MNLLGFRNWRGPTLVLFIAFWTNCLNASIIYVISTANVSTNGQSWGTAFVKIQDAVNAASPGDEIWVGSGIYREQIHLHEGVSLFGGFSGNETVRSQRNWKLHPTILDGSGTNRVVAVPHIAQTTRLDGFVIQNGHADFGAGIYSAGGEFISANNLFIHNSGDGIFGGGGAFLDATATFTVQTPITFFTNLANRLLTLHSPELSLNRIQIFPTNQYTPEVHRLLQLAANIYDATTNRGSSYPYFPSIFRPVFTNDNGTIFISGYVDASDENFPTNQWIDLAVPERRDQLTNSSVAANANIFGQSVIIGAKKGFPNFNEFSVDTVARVTRLLQVRKMATNSPPFETNQMYQLQFTNTFGVESWNSYIPPFSRTLEIQVTHAFTAFIADELGNVIWPTNGVPFATNFLPATVTISNWASAYLTNSFVLPYWTNVLTTPILQYVNASGGFTALSTNFESNGFPIPQWHLQINNRIQYTAIDSGHVVDFVNLDGPEMKFDLSKELFRASVSPIQEPSQLSGIWNTNRLNASEDFNLPTLGILKQMQLSMGLPQLSDSVWFAYNAFSVSNKDRAIAEFTKFMGYTPTIPGYQNIPMPPYLSTVAPFAPVRVFYHRISLQANDPLVHFQMSDLLHRSASTKSGLVIPPNSPLPVPSNLGKLNEVCRPYPRRGHTYRNATYFTNLALQDEDIGWSSDWDFPTGSCFNLQWLDKIHRGTPWQTLYTGSFTDSYAWEDWSGSVETNPTNDWRIIEMFLAERNSLGTTTGSGAPVFANNTFAANSGANGGAVSFAGEARLLNNIIAGNSSGLFRVAVSNDVVLQTNAVFANAAYDFKNIPDSTGVLTADPQFVSIANDNFQLLGTSPCVDAADASAISLGFVLDEPARVHGASLDLGAFELTADDSPVVLSPFLSNDAAQFVFQITGVSGESYVVEGSTDLFHWIPIATNVAANGFFTVSDPLLGQTNRFYRAVHLP